MGELVNVLPVLVGIEDFLDVFLLKKVLYVQYMVNKNILNSVHEGNVKKQRNQAKLNADDILFMSYSEMWRTTGPEPAEDYPEEAAEEVMYEEDAYTGAMAYEEKAAAQKEGSAEPAEE